MKASSSKAKGRRLQDYIRDLLRLKFIKEWNLLPKLEDDDIKCQIMGVSGEDIVLSPAARKVIPYSFECKNQEKINVWKALEQAESNAENRTPVVIIKRNRSKVYAVMEAEEWINLIRSKYANSNGERTKENNKIIRKSKRNTRRSKNSNQ
jgi:hypothetical protein